MARNQKSNEIYREIDHNLRRAYEELVNEELPDRFKELVQKLKSESQPSGRGEDGDVE